MYKSLGIAKDIWISRLTIVSREAKKKQAVRASELVTHSTALKFVNALNKPP